MALTVLVVDDDLGTRLAISDYLELQGYFTLMAEDGEKALDKLDSAYPHLIVTDIAMPRMDGFELVRRVRQRPQFRLLPVVFLTAHHETESRIRGYQLGGDVYLPKPFDLKELGAVIRNLLERSQLIETELRMRALSTPIPPSASAPAEDTSLSEEARNLALEIALHLTNREQGVLRLLSDGLSNAQIGDRLHLSPRTIEKYVSNLLRKTETNNRAELVRFAMDNHLVE
jgi:DNA-binding NarL/FixJ family response regulator